MNDIRRIALPLGAFAPLQAEARREQVSFVETTRREWEDGVNRFDGPGEMLCGCFAGECMIAMGGLTADPYVRQSSVGCIRRLYVRPRWRNQGVGASMLQHLLAEAREHFVEVRLRAENHDAARLYERFGFVAVADPNATHTLSLRQ